MGNEINNMDELYQDRDLYNSSTLLIPPSERQPHVIRFELTKGCSWKRCTYCDGYTGTKYSVKPIEEYKEHIDKVWDKIGKKSDLTRSLRRIFIGGGNALEVETEVLKEALEYTVRSFSKYTGDHPRRTALYGRTSDILKHGKEGLEQLIDIRGKWEKRIDTFFQSIPNYALHLIYWGVESGSTEVLNYVKKGCTKDELIKAAEIINELPIQTSVMIMPGLGGEKFYEQHMKETAKLLGIIKPRFLTFMGINASQDSEYARLMSEEVKKGTNRPLTKKEVATQMTDIINLMPSFHTKIGCFDKDVDKVADNPLWFSSRTLFDSDDKHLLEHKLRRCIINRKW